MIQKCSNTYCTIPFNYLLLFRLLLYNRLVFYSNVEHRIFAVQNQSLVPLLLYGTNNLRFFSEETDSTSDIINMYYATSVNL